MLTTGKCNFIYVNRKSKDLESLKEDLWKALHNEFSWKTPPDKTDIPR